MTDSATLDTAVYSIFADDPDMAELVEMFVNEMPERIDALSTHVQNADWAAVGRTAHQIKGAAGSYGFGQLTVAAGQLEIAVRGGQGEDAIRAAVAELLALCHRVRSGTGACSPIPG